LRFSSRLDWTLAPNPLARLLAAKKGAGEPILDLTESNPTHARIEYPAQEIADAFASARLLEYHPDPAGSLAVREAVADYYRGAASADRILLTASTSEAYGYLFKLLCDPGDEILVPRPSYPLFDYLARLESVRVRQYPLFYDHGWHIDLHALETAATDRTRAVVLVNPNNPTGHFLKHREWMELAAVCRVRGLAVISDEVFADYGHEPDESRIEFLAGDPPVLAFSLSGLSKTVGLPQMKLGWIVVGGRESGAAWSRLELVADTYLSVGTPVQAAAPGLLALRHDIQGRIRARLTSNLEELQSQLRSEPAVQAMRIEGGWYATLQVPRTRTEEEWALALLRDANVLVQPGYFYDFETEAFLVLSLLTETSIFEKGLSRVLDVLHHA
jgi:aspartate/methionine/tyrosine aminotransferase